VFLLDNLYVPRSRLFIITALLLSLLTFPSASAANPKYGEPCKKAGIEKTFQAITFICVKVKKKLVWTGKQSSGIGEKTSVVSKESIPTITTPVPTSFQDLYANRKGIAYGAWLKTSNIMKTSEAFVPTTEVFIGPKTKPWNTNTEYIFRLVSRAFPNATLQEKVIVFFYNYKDLNWAQSQVRSKLSEQDYLELSANENNHLVDSNCQPELKDCLGSKAVATRAPTNLAIMLIGVSNNPGMFVFGGSSYGDPGLEESNKKGLLIAHEYFHTLQDKTLVGKSLDRTDWPPPWVIEGSANFVENATVNFDSFSKYFSWRGNSMGNLVNAKGVTESFVADFMDLSHYKDNWSGFNKDWYYHLGSRIMEALVSIKGPESIMAFHEQMGSKIGFQNAFINTFGISYDEAIPIVAKTVAANFNGQN